MNKEKKQTGQFKKKTCPVFLLEEYLMKNKRFFLSYVKSM